MLVFPEHFTKPPHDPLRDAITRAYRMDETAIVEELLQAAKMPDAELDSIIQQAKTLVEAVRKERMGKSGLDSFLYQYNLSSEEGIALMCLSEALLRIPDADTIDRLIRDKITAADWEMHAGKSTSFFVNAATWGLMLTGKVLSRQEIHDQPNKLKGVIKKLAERTGEPVIRKAVAQAMRILGKQFVMGRTIEEATKRARSLEKIGFRYSYDMLGEAARTEEHAEKYFKAYQDAITAIGKVSEGKDVFDSPGISVKLSALHPRYELSQRDRVLKEMVPRVLALAKLAKEQDIGFTIDAEEADRLELSMDIIEKVFSDPVLQGWDGFGLAVQSYQKRAMPLLDWLIDLGRRHRRRIMVRLIKGAYWDSEIKWSQELGLEGYPVLTRKPSTDISFIACAKKVLTAPDVICPQFATHNANSVATILDLVDDKTDFEFQCLHGMGQDLYEQVVPKEKMGIPCRIYAPVGSHEELLPYLVRRLLENGANTSFVNRIVDEKVSIAEIIECPMKKVSRFVDKPHPQIPLPVEMYGEYRNNSLGIDFSNQNQIEKLAEDMNAVDMSKYSAQPTVVSITKKKIGTSMEEAISCDPNNLKSEIGKYYRATEAHVDEAITIADAAFPTWDSTPMSERAACLMRAGHLLEEHRAELMTLLVREAGKTLPDAIAEVREAADFCYYYATQAMHLAENPEELPGPTGEFNQISLTGRGPIACISPWNFPLAIFFGQITAALVMGNPVLAKPAEPTVLIAARGIELLHEAGVPKEVLQLVPGRGSIVGNRMVADERIKGVIFTGSTETAQMINQNLASRKGAIVPLIAETGGQNAMIVDSSALPEQVVTDVLMSAFGSAGQRCSALRVLFVQEDIAENVIYMLSGAMAELRMGDPGLLQTDIGPVIDNNAKKSLEEHAKRMDKEAKLIYQVMQPKETESGCFFAPRAYEIESLKQLKREVFGPILHVVRFKSSELDQVIEDINHTEYGLTMGIHSRIDETIDYITARTRVGNTYVNRNMIGAVVGVQPFGGEGLSGTGPKAGGPHYLLRLCNERTLTINTAAAGGNASLMSLSDN